MNCKSEGKFTVFIDLSEPCGTISVVKDGAVGVFEELKVEKGPEVKLKEILVGLLERMGSDISSVRCLAVSKQSYSTTRGRVIKSFLQGLADGLKVAFKEVDTSEILKSH